MQIYAHMKNDTARLTQRLMAELSQKDRTVIGQHIRNLFSEGELGNNWNL